MGIALRIARYRSRYFRGLKPNRSRKWPLNVDRSPKPDSKPTDVTESDDVIRRTAARRILNVSKN